MKTLRVTRTEADRLDLGRFPNAGPYPNITGMKMKWAICGRPQDVLCISDGKYLYHVDRKTYGYIESGRYL